MIKKYLEKLEFNLIISELEKNCLTFYGKIEAANLMPISNESDVVKALAETENALSLIKNEGLFPISQISDLSLPIKKIESNYSVSCKYLLEFATIFKMARELFNYYTNSESNVEYLSPYFEKLYQNKKIEDLIFKSIISENEISDNASTKLASIRKAKKNIEIGIKEKLNSIIHSSSYSKYLMENVITIRNNRYVVPVKEEYRSKVQGYIHDTSASGSTLYIEPTSVFEMNNKISNLIIEENNEIENILYDLSSTLFELIGFIKSNINLIAHLDFVSSKAKNAINYNSTKPTISNYIDLIDARHPLISKDIVVPVSLHIGKEGFTTLVITGPNTGGKTVTLKTVGLLCLMAQSGLYIPAKENSKIKIFDNIFADIGDEQSIEESLSTFSSHLKNIINMLDNFTNNSLILVDELGSGTDPIEGANLAISLLEFFHKKGAFTIATTHYHEIKNYCLEHNGFENASCEFDVKNMIPTYKIIIGIPGKSNAFAISKKLGMPVEIIIRASSLISKPDLDIEELIKKIYDTKKQIENEEKEINKNLHQIELLRKSLEHEYNSKLKQEEEKIEKAKKEAREILLDAKEKANAIIKEISNTKDIKKANSLRKDINDLIETNKSKSIDLSVLLQLNEKNQSKIQNNQKESKLYIQNNKSKTISSEINLIGETVDIACDILDKYLDNCKMANLHQIRIIHGKGSGKLRAGIHAYLKKSKYVSDFKIAGYGEGDYGVTIVNIK